MLIIINNKATKEQIQKAAEDLSGYVKFVVDLERNIITIGGLRHFEGEQLLIEGGSKQSDLWGGGFDLETRELDFDSMINIRPSQGNQSREVLDKDLRSKIARVVKERLDL